MDELESKVIETIRKLSFRPEEGKKEWTGILATAALAAVGALAFWYAIQSTKPKDVLQQVRALEAEVTHLKQELLTNTRPSDVLIQVTALQRTVIDIQRELSNISQRINGTKERQP